MTLVVDADVVEDQPEGVHVSVRTKDKSGSEVHLVGWEPGGCRGDLESQVQCDSGVQYVLRGGEDALVVERIPTGEAPPKVMLRLDSSGS